MSAMPWVVRGWVRDVLQLRSVPEKGGINADAPDDSARARARV